METSINSNFGKLNADSSIVYAPNVLEIDGIKIFNPADATYLTNGWKRVIDIIPSGKLGVQYVKTSRGKLIDDIIYVQYDEIPLPAKDIKYKVEEIVYGLIENDALQPVKAIAGDYWDLFMLRTEINSSNDIWKEAFPMIKQKLIDEEILTEDQIYTILKEAEIQ